jgi:orotidine-5'-phosphate decarboxylase
MADVILALDKIDDYEQMLNVMLDTIDHVDGFKVTACHFMNGYIKNIRTILDIHQRRIGSFKNAAYKDLLIDLKVADVGVMSTSDGRWIGTNSEIIDNIADWGTHVTVHGFPGEYSIAEAATAVIRTGIDALLLTGMTHKGADRWMKQPEYMEWIVEQGEKHNVGGYIAPGNDYDFLKRLRKLTDRDIWSPGFGRQVTLRGGESIPIDEQIKRWMEIVEPTKEHHGRIIVGSYIMNDDDPGKRAEDICSIAKGEIK